MAAQNTTLTPEVMAAEAEGPRPDVSKKSMSYEEFLAWAGEDTRAEWVNGEVITFMPPLNPHQTVIEFLYQLLNLFSSVFDLGRLRVAPFELKITPEGNSREPDLMFIAKAHLERLTTARVVGPPDLIIEVVSDDSTHRDRVDKFDEYEAGGVPEYWIIDNRPQRRRALFYQLDEQGQYQSVPVEADGIYRSAVLPGFWLRVEWLWAEQPDVLRALAEVIGPDRMAEALRQALTGPEHHESQQPQ
ncbi:MAG: Uma2 family endonuclease [Anaerolineae bacterium]|nr:Uma2 family endonuclease [Anaerolineae bacterium]